MGSLLVGTLLLPPPRNYEESCIIHSRVYGRRSLFFVGLTKSTHNLTHYLSLITNNRLIRLLDETSTMQCQGTIVTGLPPRRFRYRQWEALIIL